MTLHAVTGDSFMSTWIHRFSTLKKLVTATVVMRLFITYIMARRTIQIEDTSQSGGIFSPRERRQALHILCRHVQHTMLEDDIKQLHLRQRVSENSKLKKLVPFQDEEARPSPPENFMVKEISSRFISLSWSLKSSDSLEIPDTHFVLQWKKFSEASWESLQVYNKSVESCFTSVVIDSLNPVPNYDVRLFTSIEFGCSLQTLVLTKLTPAEVPSGSPRNISDEIIAGEKGEVKKTSSQATTLHSLKSFTNYSIRALAYTLGGESNMSEPVICRTEEDVPEEPADLKVFLSSANSSLVSWLPPRHSSGIITKYTVFWKSEDSEHLKEKSVFTSDFNAEVDEFFTGLRRLKDSTKYSVWVKASTSIGTGRASQIETFTVGSKV
ncbi:unnamed protein product [Orchesella dallaii]|uniref:Fibronectin type-III domain-containing protein n=1 Tax=Orchesella dallaii TaxID=48710 RepID=A0ABP1RJB4_9HEXA